MIFLPYFDQQSNAAVPLLLLIPHPLHQQQFFPFLLPLFLYAISISPATTNANHHNPSLASTPYLSPVLHPRHLQTRTSLFNQPPRAPSNTTALSTVRILQPFSAPQNLSTNSIHPPTHHLLSSAAFITTIPSHLLRTTISSPILTAAVQQPLPLSFSSAALMPPNSPKSHISASQSPSPPFSLSSSATRHTPCRPTPQPPATRSTPSLFPLYHNIHSPTTIALPSPVLISPLFPSSATTRATSLTTASPFLPPISTALQSRRLSPLFLSTNAAIDPLAVSILPSPIRFCA